MTILICGFGSIGRRHLRNLRSLGVDNLVVYRTGMSQLATDELDGIPVEHDLGDALERWEPEAAVIANPTALHMDVAIPAAEAGCHLLVEKPVSHNLDRTADLLAALENANVRALVGFQFRFHPGMQRVKELLHSGAIGRPLFGRVHWGEYLPDWHPWEDYRHSYSAKEELGGGVVLTLCHPFDYLRWFFGEVESLSAHIGNSASLDIEVEDVADAILHFQEGLSVSVHLDYLQRPARHALEIVGSEGTLRWDAHDGEVQWWSQRKERWERSALPEVYERNSMFLAEMGHFLDVISGSAQPICTVEDGIRALEIALAIKRSSLEGGCRVNPGEAAG